MIQTASLFPALPLGSRAMTTTQTGEAAGHFADSFAQASDTAAPEIFAVLTAGDGTRQDGAATGNGLPILALADDPASSWEPAIAPPPAGRPIATTTAAPADAAVTTSAAASLARADPAMARPADGTDRATTMNQDAVSGETDETGSALPAGLPVAASPPIIDPFQEEVTKIPLAAKSTKVARPALKVPDITTPIAPSLPRSRSARRGELAPIAASAPQPSSAAETAVAGNFGGLDASPQRGEAAAPFAATTPAPVTRLPGLIAAEPANTAPPAPRTPLRVGLNAATTSPGEPTLVTNRFAAVPSAKRQTGAETVAATRIPTVQPASDTSVLRPTSSDPIASSPVTFGSVPTTPHWDGEDAETVMRPIPIASLSVGERDGEVVAPPAQPRGSLSAMLDMRSPGGPVRTLVDARVSSQPQASLLSPRLDLLDTGTATPPASPITSSDAPTLEQAPAATRSQLPQRSTGQSAGFTPRQSFAASLMQSSTPIAADTIDASGAGPTPMMGALVPPSVATVAAVPSIVSNGSIADRTAEPATGAPQGLPAESSAIGSPRWTATDATTPVALAVARPDALQPQSGTVASAAQVFGAAIQAATKLRDEAKTMPGSTDAALSSAPLSPFQEVRIADAQQAPIDVRQERWPHAMIERIEILRDAADATDTRIRLIPDALGAIDVSVKKEGDTVHVHFNAEQAATRTLLQEAQPRLVELAEARGLKLGQASLGDGGAGGNAGSSQQRASVMPQTPNRTARATAVTPDATEDTRIA